MDFSLTDEQRQLQQTIREFAQAEIAPRAEQWDREHTFPTRVIRQLGELGVMGLSFPEAYGGVGAGTLAQALAVEELARVDASVAITVAANVALGGAPLLLFGTEEQKRRWLVPLARGELLGAFASTEPGMGSDVAACQTRAEAREGSWVISGTKSFITNAGTELSGFVIITAVTGEADGRREISTILVPNGAPGFQVGRAYRKMGWHASATHELVFSDCVVEQTATLGPRGKGVSHFLKILDGGRIGVAALAVGSAQGCLDISLAYAQQRQAFGKAIGQYQAIQFMLAELAAQLQAARLLTYEAACLKDADRPYSQAAAMAKLVASELAVRAADIAVQVHGGLGFMDETAAARYYRDARILTLGEGTSEIMKIVISRHLGLPGMSAAAQRGEVYVLGAARTPIGKFLGGLSAVPATELGAIAIRAAVERSGVAPGDVEDVFVGQVLQAGAGQAPARQAALGAGLPDSASAVTINKVCASGLEAIQQAAARLWLGDASCVVAGGMESMSRAPHLLINARTGLRLGGTEVADAAIHDGLWCPVENQHMGQAAEWIAEQRGIGRDDLDEYSLNSHQKAVAAQRRAGRFDEEIVPVPVPGSRHGTLTADESPRPDTDREKLRQLKPAFTPNGLVTAGNAPGLTDGAAGLVLAAERWVERRGLRPLARVSGYATAAVAPGRIFEAPELAVRKLCERTGTQLADYDLLEVNEAFAAQIVANGRALEWDWAKVNVNGGAIALGHPIGATGARLVVTLLYALRERGLRRGLAGLCHGGGGAVAMSFEVL